MHITFFSVWYQLISKSLTMQSAESFVVTRSEWFQYFLGLIFSPQYVIKIKLLVEWSYNNEMLKSKALISFHDWSCFSNFLPMHGNQITFSFYCHCWCFFCARITYTYRIGISIFIQNVTIRRIRNENKWIIPHTNEKPRYLEQWVCIQFRSTGTSIRKIFVSFIFILEQIIRNENI